MGFQKAVVAIALFGNKGIQASEKGPVFSGHSSPFSSMAHDSQIYSVASFTCCEMKWSALSPSYVPGIDTFWGQEAGHFFQVAILTRFE